MSVWKVRFNFEMPGTGLMCSIRVSVCPAVVYASFVSEWGKSQLWIKTSEGEIRAAKLDIGFQVGEIPSAGLRNWVSGREKSLQQSLAYEWEKSYNGVSWRDMVEAVLLPPSRGTSHLRVNRLHWKLLGCTCKHAIIHLSKALDATGKTACTSLVYGFMKLVRWGDNPNKKTLIYIPYFSCRHCPSVYNPSCSQTSQTH